MPAVRGSTGAAARGTVQWRLPAARCTTAAAHGRHAAGHPRCCTGEALAQEHARHPSAGQQHACTLLVLPHHICSNHSLPSTPQGVAFADELLSLVHAVRKAAVRAGRTCGVVQVVDLGEAEACHRM